MGRGKRATAARRLASRPGCLVVLVGVSGAGKDTLARRAKAARPLKRLVSVTSRPPREGEVHGHDYHFLSRAEFEARAARGEMYEWVEFGGNLYGTLKADLDEDGLKLAIRENEGAKDMKDRLGAVVVGVLPPSPEIRAERLRDRGDPEDEVLSRLELDRAREEEIRDLADHVVVNDDLEAATARFVALLDELCPQ